MDDIIYSENIQYPCPFQDISITGILFENCNWMYPHTPYTVALPERGFPFFTCSQGKGEKSYNLQGFKKEEMLPACVRCLCHTTQLPSYKRERVGACSNTCTTASSFLFLRMWLTTFSAIFLGTRATYISYFWL